MKLRESRLHAAMGERMVLIGAKVVVDGRARRMRDLFSIVT